MNAGLILVKNANEKLLLTACTFVLNTPTFTLTNNRLCAGMDKNFQWKSER